MNLETVIYHIMMKLNHLIIAGVALATLIKKRKQSLYVEINQVICLSGEYRYREIMIPP